MAEFCSQCTPFDLPDIDLADMALNLNNGYSESFLCEGCNNRGLYKDEAGKLFLAKLIDGEISLHAVHMEQLLKSHE